MKLYCLAAASLMLLGAAVAEEPNLRGVADTFKEQVAEALGNPDDIKMYERCTFDACCEYEDDEDSEDIKMLSGKCSCPWKKQEMCGGGHRIPPRPPQPHERGGCAHCEDCEGVDEASDSFLTYCRSQRFKRRCIRRGCISGDDGPKPHPKPHPKPQPRGPKCENLSRHCYDCYCNEEGKESSDSFLSYCNPRACPDSCSDSFACDGGEERHHGGPHGSMPPHGPPNGGGGGGGCSQYNGNPALCAQNGCLPMGGMGGIKCIPEEDSGDVEMEGFPEGEENRGPDDNEGGGNENGWPDEDAGNDYDSGDGNDYDSGDGDGEEYRGPDDNEDGDEDEDEDEGEDWDSEEGEREAMDHGEEQSRCNDGGCP